MKKSLIIILAVAIIGGLGVYQKAHSSTSTSAVQGATSSSPVQTSSSNSTTQNQSASSTPSTYKDGTYNGQSEDTIYGTIQVQAVISGGKIVSVNLLQMPFQEGHSREVTAVAGPLLKQQTIKNQTASVDFVSGATTTSEAYQSSLQAALDQAA